MGKCKALLLYISEHSGHHCATLAIEKALHGLSPDVETLNINSFNYTNPISEKIINRAYMGVVKRKPEIWDYLYDNPNILEKAKKLREIIHKFNIKKIRTLFDEFSPHVIICTQAFPCGMIAAYKKNCGSKIPLIGVLTDYAPHSYWIHDNVDRYIVPSLPTGRKLIENGVEEYRIEAYGILIDPKFRETHDRDKICEKLGLDKSKTTILIMGGTQGLGPMEEVVELLDKSPLDLQIIITTGTNKKLYKSLYPKSFTKKVIVLPYAANIDELMQVSRIIITKPGGITTAEALAKGLPMLIVNPLPGQEAMNAKFLLQEGVAVKANNSLDVEVMLKDLLTDENVLRSMSQKARELSKPDSSINIAKLILALAEKKS